MARTTTNRITRILGEGASLIGAVVSAANEIRSRRQDNRDLLPLGIDPDRR